MYESRPATSALTRIHVRVGARSASLRVAAAVLVIAAMAIGAIFAIAGEATATPATKKVTGHIETQLAPGPQCQAASGLCFAGRIHGVISGSFSGGINSITPTLQADVALIDATTTISTRHGDLHFAHQQAVYNINATGRGEFAWILRITSGTGRYAGATGYLQGAGNTPPSTGESTTTYIGEIKLG
jgi:hypothetical protein